MRRDIILWFFLLTGALLIAGCITHAPAETTANKSETPKIIFDTDFGGDADDLGAIAMLHHYADAGVIDFLAISSWSNEEYALPALAAVNQYYGRPDLPLGVRSVPKWRTEWNHTKVIADQFPHDQASLEAIPDAVTLYRTLLAEADPHSITIVTVGPLANIQNLLRSEPDAVSPLKGADLFDQKVHELVIMGGRFPDDAANAGPEWNFDGNMSGVTQFVLNTVKRPVIFSGYEVGNAIKVGVELNDHPKATPLYVGYKYFSEHAPWINADYVGEILDNSSFDQTAVVYAAIGGVGEFWTLSAPGTVSADTAGNNSWQADSTGRHRYLILTGDIEATATYIAEAMTHLPE